MPTLPSSTPYYGGKQSENPVTLYMGSADPSSNDKDVNLGDEYIKTSAQKLYKVMGKDAGTVWKEIVTGEGSFPITPYVVGPNGGYSTIQSALNAAALDTNPSFIFIQPGTYNENLTVSGDISLFGFPGSDGAIGGTDTAGNSPLVIVTGSLTIDSSTSESANYSWIKNIYFTPTSGDVFTYVSSESFENNITFHNCILQVNEQNKYIFINNGFSDFSFYSCSLTSGVGISANLCKGVGSQVLWNANFLNCYVNVNDTSPLVLSDDGLFLQFFAGESIWNATFDISASPAANFNLLLRDCVINSNPSPAQAIVKYGSNAGRVDALNCFYLGGTGGFAESTNSNSDSQSNIVNTFFTSTLNLISTEKSNFYGCSFYVNGSPAITMSSSGNNLFSSCNINCDNNPVISGSGSGTLSLLNTSYSNGSSLAGTLTISSSSTSFAFDNSTSISSGTGTIKMSSANNADNSAWISLYLGNTKYWIPAFTTNSP